MLGLSRFSHSLSSGLGLSALAQTRPAFVSRTPLISSLFRGASQHKSNLFLQRPPGTFLGQRTLRPRLVLQQQEASNSFMQGVLGIRIVKRRIDQLIAAADQTYRETNPSRPLRATERSQESLPGRTFPVLRGVPFPRGTLGLTGIVDRTVFEDASMNSSCVLHRPSSEEILNVELTTTEGTSKRQHNISIAGGSFKDIHLNGSCKTVVINKQIDTDGKFAGHLHARNGNIEKLFIRDMDVSRAEMEWPQGMEEVVLEGCILNRSALVDFANSVPNQAKLVLRDCTDEDGNLIDQLDPFIISGQLKIKSDNSEFHSYPQFEKFEVGKDSNQGITIGTTLKGREATTSIQLAAHIRELMVDCAHNCTQTSQNTAETQNVHLIAKNLSSSGSRIPRSIGSLSVNAHGRKLKLFNQMSPIVVRTLNLEEVSLAEGRLSFIGQNQDQGSWKVTSRINITNPSSFNVLGLKSIAKQFASDGRPKKLCIYDHGYYGLQKASKKIKEDLSKGNKGADLFRMLEQNNIKLFVNDERFVSERHTKGVDKEGLKALRHVRASQLVGLQRALQRKPSAGSLEGESN